MPKHDKSIKELREQVRALQRPAGQMTRAELVKFLETRGAEGPKPEPAYVEKSEIKRLTRGRQEEKEIPQVEIYTEEKVAPKVESKLAGIKGKAVSERQRAIEEEVRQKLSSRKGIQKAEMEILAAKLRKAGEREVETKKTIDAAPAVAKKGVEMAVGSDEPDKMITGLKLYRNFVNARKAEGYSESEAKIMWNVEKKDLKKSLKETK